MDQNDSNSNGVEPVRQREPILNLPTGVVLFIALCAGIHLLRVYGLTLEQDIELLRSAAFIPVRYTGGYDIEIYAFTSPLTYSLLHAGVAHLAINMLWLAAFGSPLANRIGLFRFVLFWVAASVAAALLHFLLHSHDFAPLVGASGAISGMMGAATRFAFRMDHHQGPRAFRGRVLPISVVLRVPRVILFVSVWMGINFITGFFALVPNLDGGGIAWEAHVGGFLLGFFAIGLFDRRIDDTSKA